MGNRKQQIQMSVACLALLIAPSACPAPASSFGGGNVLFVDDDAPANGDGATWETGYRFLQDALSFAGDPENSISEIRVGQGVYQPDRDGRNPDGAGDRAATFSLRTGLTIRGGFAGFGAEDPDARDIELYETTLSGDLLGDDGDGFKNNNENSFHVVSGNGVHSAVLDGVMMTGGYANGGGDNAFGGAVYNTESEVTLRDCTAFANIADLGGAIYNLGSTTASGCTLSGNVANDSGGAIYTGDQGFLLVTNCVFVGNEAGLSGGALHFAKWALFTWIEGAAIIGNTALFGGGVRLDGLEINVIDCVIADNIAGLGGGMYSESDPILTDTTFSNNVGALGGGFCNFEGSPSMTGCVFDNNHAALEGGGLYSQFGEPNLTECSFLGNSAEQSGGAIYSNDALSVADCTFEDNSSQDGGGIDCVGCTLTLTESAFTGNSAVYSGGGVHAELAVVEATGCSFSGNTAEDGGGYYAIASESTLSACTFLDNAASRGAGAVLWEDTTSLLSDCVFENNAATSAGAGLTLAGGEAEMIRCTFNNNVAEDGGGAMYNCISGLTVVACDLRNNSAGGRGGAILSEQSSTVMLINCAIVQNFADRGGGMFSTDTNLTVANCLVAANEADSAGGGIYLDDPDHQSALINCTIVANSAKQTGTGGIVNVGLATVRVDDSVVWDNSDGQVSGPFDINFSNIQGDWNGNGDNNIDADPLFADPGKGDYRLLAGSPCIDAADNTAVLACVFVDLDGNERFVDDPNVRDTGFGRAPLVDMGAYEYLSMAAIEDDCNQNGFADACEIAAGTVIDCNDNGIPNECEEAIDCNNNGIADECDILGGVSSDCNANGIPDECEAGDDCNDNGILDECEWVDCNCNERLDVCDITGGISQDGNENGIPDECELPLGDLNENGAVDTTDLLLLLSQWGPCYMCNCNVCPADLDLDCNVGTGDLLILLGNWG